jgi:C-terminal processing protease CtpA/Prc
VQSIEPGSRAEALSIQSGDMLWSVDGRRVADLDSLTALIQGRTDGAPLTTLLLRGSGRNHRLFDCHVRELPGEDIQAVGPPPDPALREPR